MRRFIALSLAAIMTFSLCSCTKKTEGKIDIAEYKGLEVYESDIKVTKDELQQAINQFCEAHKKTETLTEGEVEETDTVNIDYVGSIKVDGKAYEFPQGSDKGYALDIDNNQFIDGFASGLVGKKVGEEVTLKLKFPEDYGRTTQGPTGEPIDLNGKKVTFKVTINSRDVEVIPEFTDKFVKKNYGAIADNKKAFKEYVKEQIQIGKFFSTVWKDYSRECKVASYNSEEKESVINAQNEQAENMLSMYFQTNIDTYLEACGKSKKDWDEKMEGQAEDILKEKMIMDTIAEENELTVKVGTDEFKSLKKQYAQYQNRNTKDIVDKDIVDTLTSQKVQKFIFDNKKVLEGERETEAESTTEAETTTEAAKEE
ncbi:MAG: FKBP-type peptidyl-prolyl cis-trans isomerase [Lachnospiraceae bacterium]|nr:FKBP-type peptidyl-prolyl cis-trans isomerase [Lachnospiraceae bacterium]